MLYQMKQKVLCWGDDYLIRDEQGRELFLVDGRAFSFGDSLSFQDMQGRELAHIRQRLMSWGKTYDIVRGGRTTTVRKHLFTFLSCKFEVDVPGPDDLEASGDLLDMEYQFRRLDGDVVASVSKRWFAFSDTYGVRIAEGVDPVIILASAVVIDLCCHGDGKSD